MSSAFTELDYQQTPHGEISLRRRAEPRLEGKVLYEVKLGDDFLMSSLFTEAEEQLSTMSLSKLDGNQLDVVVGGLGLGYTAWAALKFQNVVTVQVVDVMKPVIDWHEQHLVPLGERLTSDQRCRFLHADFFQLSVAENQGFIVGEPDKKVHAVLLDIDHSPSHWLNPQNQSFYCQAGLQSVAEKMHPGGVFGMWSNDPPDQRFIDLLNQVFVEVSAPIIQFPNPYTGETSTNSLYIGQTQ